MHTDPLLRSQMIILAYLSMYIYMHDIVIAPNDLGVYYFILQQLYALYICMYFIYVPIFRLHANLDKGSESGVTFWLATKLPVLENMFLDSTVMILMARWLRGRSRSIFISLIMQFGLLSNVLFIELGFFSPICDSCLFKIKAMMFPPYRCGIFWLYFCFYFTITEEVSPRSRTGCMFNPLELFLCDIGGAFFTIGLLVSID